MPDISKINAVAIADIEKVDGILAANIEKVNGLVFSTAPAFVGLLDETYGSGAAAAYSTRRLASATTVLMRVRRDTGTGGAEDDDEADVAYDSNNQLSLDSAISNASAGVTATTLGQFINVGTVNGTTYTNPDSLTVTASCFVSEWTDQSGNANDAEQTTQIRQPQIHDGTVNTDLITENGETALQYTSNGTGLEAVFNYSVTAQSTFVAATFVFGASDRLVSQRASGNDYAGTNAYIIGFVGSSTSLASYIGGALRSAVTVSENQHILYSSVHTGSALTNKVNGTTGSVYSHTLNSTYEHFDIGMTLGPEYWQGKIQEVVMYTANRTSNRSNIEGNINAHFSIY